MLRMIMTFWESEGYYVHYRNVYEKSLNIHMRYQSMGWFPRKIIRIKLQILHYSKFRLEKKINLTGMLLLLHKSHGHSFRVVDIGGYPWQLLLISSIHRTTYNFMANSRLEGTLGAFSSFWIIGDWRWSYLLYPRVFTRGSSPTYWNTSLRPGWFWSISWRNHF